MKVVILAGGYGTRISEELAVVPKPLVEVGSRPILWHVMKIYAAHGFTDFVICCGLRGHLIKRYFSELFVQESDVTVDLRSNQLEIHRTAAEPWRVTLIDTGDTTSTGGRISKIRHLLGEETFCLTYGDRLADVDIAEVIRFHKSHGKLASITTVQPPGRFGVFTLQDQDPAITSFIEKPREGATWINGGFFVLEPTALDYIEGDEMWEEAPLQRLASEGELKAFRHLGFWQAMDTLRDQHTLQALWESGAAPWAIWRNDSGAKSSRATSS